MILFSITVVNVTFTVTVTRTVTLQPPGSKGSAANGGAPVTRRKRASKGTPTPSPTPLEQLAELRTTEHGGQLAELAIVQHIPAKPGTR